MRVRSVRGFTGLFVALVFVGIYTVEVRAAEYELLTDLGASAQTIGVGGVEGFSKASSVIFENPAGLGRSGTNSLSMFTTTLLDDAYYKNIALSGVTPFGTVGFGYMEATVYDIPFTSEDTITNEFKADSYFDYKDTAFKVGYQFALSDSLSLGGSYVSYARNLLNISAKGANMDAGLLYTQPNYMISFFVRNIIPQSKVVFSYSDGTTATESLPTEPILGGKYRFNDSVDLMGQIRYRRSKALNSFGIVFTPREYEYIELSGGYREYLVLDRVKGGITLGLGLELYGLRFNYAYEKLEDHPQYDNKSYFSVSMNL